MRTIRSLAPASLALLLSLSLAASAAAQKRAYTDPNSADDDFPVQGEYAGELEGKDGKQPWGGQVIAQGKGKFKGVGYPGGLPGAGWNGKDKKPAEGGRTASGEVVLKGDDGVTITIADGVLTVATGEGQVLGKLKKVTRQSPTAGAKPPEGAVVLFDGTTAEHFKNGRMTEDGLLMEGVVSNHTAQSYTCHVEFLLPYMPEARGQGRGNSGLYVQGRYEIQMLDSFGLEGENNECGGIYTIAKPKVNMCFPPLSWQTYDVDFTAPEYKDGKKVKNARITVRHNGVVIHDDLELPKETPGGVSGEKPEPGPSIMLQNHGDPVRYRNIWVVEKK